MERLPPNPNWLTDIDLREWWREFDFTEMDEILQLARSLTLNMGSRWQQ